MNWSLAGWITIGIATILLGVFSLLFDKREGYKARRVEVVKRLLASKSTTFEKGYKFHLGLGQRMWSDLYPGLGLQSLTILPALLDSEAQNSGGFRFSSGDGVITVLARQVANAQYQDGYSILLERQPPFPNLPGPTPMSSTAGLLMILDFEKHGTLALAGNYGIESVLFSESIYTKEGNFYSAVGNVTAQAVLFPSMSNILVGEDIFLLPGSISKTAGIRAGWLTEDILRIGIIIALIVLAILKMVGVI